MQGTRRPDGTLPHEMVAGDYALAGPEQRVVWVCSPDGEPGHVTAPLWSITVEEDGTVSIDPSIWWDKEGSPPGWHGYLRHGIWEAC
jgi:hypothetical protein